MADAKLTALTAAGALAAADLFYVSQSAASRKATGTQLLALVGTTYVPLAGGTMTGALTIASGTLTASAPALSITQTWNGPAATFFGLDLSFTNTSIADAYPINVKVGGSSIFYLRYNGAANFVQNVSALNFLSTSSAIAFGENYGIRNGSTTSVSWTSATATSGTTDLFLVRDAAATLAQRNGTNAQTLRVYGTYTDSSNYERLSLSTTAGTSVNITAETLGTGGDNLDIVLTPAGGGFVSFPGGLIKLPLNATFRNTDSIGNGLFYMDVSNLVLRRGDAASSFGAILFGGTSSSEPGIKKNGAALDLRLADDSAYTDLKLRNLLAGGGNGSYVQTPSMTVANLAAAATAGAGARAFVTDANATTYLSTVAGGGANKVPVVSDGTNWLIG